MGIVAVATGYLDGRMIAIAGGSSGYLSRWDLADQSRYGDRIPTGFGIGGLATGVLQGESIVVAGSDKGSAIPRARVWRLRDGELVHQMHTARDIHEADDSTHALAIHQGEHPGLLVAGCGGVRSYELPSGRPLGDLPISRSSATATAVAVEAFEGHPLVVCGDTDGWVHVWDLASKRQISATQVLAGLSSHGATGVTLGRLDGRLVSVSAWFDGPDHGRIIRVTDAHTGTLVGTLSGHDSETTALTGTEVDGEHIVVSGSTDGTVRAWSLAATCRGPEPTISYALRGAPAVGEVEGQAAIAYAFGREYEGSIAFFRLNDGTAIAPSSQPYRLPPPGMFGAGCVLGAASNTLLAATLTDAGVQVFDLVRDKPIGRPVWLPGIVGRFRLGELDRQAVLAVVATLDDSPDDMLRTIQAQSGVDATTPLQIPYGTTGDPLGRYSVPLCKAVGELGGRRVAVLQGRGRLGVVDLDQRVLIGEPVRGLGRRPIGSVAVGELAGHAVVVYSVIGFPLWIWRLDNGYKRAIEVDRPVDGITLTRDSTIVVGSTPPNLLTLQVHASFFQNEYWIEG
jgi:WD40 repeat protein